MKRSLIRSFERVIALVLGLVVYSNAWAATYSTYKDGATTGTSGAFGNANYQRFKINADWMFNTYDNDIAATADAVQLDSIKVYWHSSGHNNADIGKASGNEVDPYLVVTTPQGVIVGISAAGAKWTASGSSTFEFTDLVISPNAQYYYYFATDVSSLTVGGAMSGAKQARFTGAWHGATSSSATSDTTVCVMSEGKYSIRCDFEVSAATATTITTTSEGVSLSTGSDPVVVKGAVADGVVTVASGATVPTLTVVGEATTLKLTDSLTATYLYLPATTTIDASDVTFTMPGSDETEATTTLVSGKISAASNPSVTLPTPAEGYAFESPAYTDAGLAVTITKFANASLDIGSSTVNWSEVKPEGWVNSPVPTITVAYTDGGKIVFDEDVQAASIAPDGTGSLVLERGADVTVSIAAVAIDANAPAMDITFKNFTAIPTYSPYYTAGSDIVRADGTETLTSHPLISTDNAAGTFYFTQPAIMDAFTLFGNKTVYFNAGTTGSFGRFVLGNTANKTQIVTQNDGTITVTGNAAPSSNQASILLGHYRGNVTLNTLGGTFNALNASTRLGWDGTATWAIGGGTEAAEANVLGIVNGANGHTGAGTLNIFANGTLNVGSGGIAFSYSSNGGAINLAGGTIKATADTTIANAKAAGTILNQNKTTKIDTDEYTVTLSAPLSGSGVLHKQGSGTLKVTGAGTSSGRHEINGGTLLLSGNGATLGNGGFNMKGNGAHLDIEPGEGNTITLAADYLINSTSGNNSPVVNINAGTVENNCTGVSQYGQFGQSTVNVNDGAEFKLNNARQLGWNMFTTLNVNNGGMLTIANTQQLSRQLKLNGGVVKLTGVDVPLETLGNRTITVTEDSSIVAEATETATNPAMVVSNGTMTVSVDAAKTLTLAAPVVDGADATSIAQPVSKTGEGTLKLTKASTATGTLTVSAGTLALDGGSWAGTVAVGAAGTLDVITSETVADGALLAAGTFTLADGATVKENGTAVDVAVEADGIHKVAKVTVPVVANTVVTVTVGGETVSPTTEGGNVYKVAPDSVVTVTYAAAEGYAISGTTVYTVDTASATTFEITDTATAQYVARVRNYGTNQDEDFTSLNAAIAVADGTTYANSITLLADITDAVTIDKAIYLAGQGRTISAAVTISSGGYLLLMGPTLTGKLTIGANGAFAVTGTGSVLPEVETQDGASIALRTLSADTVALTVTTLTVNGTLTLSSTAQGTVRGTPYKAFSYVTANATFGEGAEIVGDGEYSASTEDEGDNTVVSMTITAVAKIGDEYYDDLDEAVADAIANDTVVDLLIQPAAAVTLGVGQTLKVKAYSYTLEVNLASGLTNPPYSISSALNTDTTITTYTVNVAFAKIGNTTYPTLAAAIAAAESGDTITLLADVTLDATIAIAKNLTLDLDDYTITASGINAITTSGALTVGGSSGSVSVTSGNSVVLTSSAAMLTVSGGATLSPTPTTTVPRHRVKTVTSSGTTTYSVEAIPGTTFTVY